MKLRDVLEEIKIIEFLKGFLSGSAEGSQTVKDLDKVMNEPMPGHEEMTKAEYFNDMMKKKGIKL